MKISTTDLCDASEARLADGRVQVMQPGLLAFGRRTAFAGPAATLKLVIVNGAVRDADEIDACDVAVRALALNPRRSVKRGIGESGVPVSVLGVRIAPPMWIYGDRDGVIVSTEAL